MSGRIIWITPSQCASISSCSSKPSERGRARSGSSQAAGAQPGTVQVCNAIGAATGPAARKETIPKLSSRSLLKHDVNIAVSTSYLTSVSKTPVISKEHPWKLLWKTIQHVLSLFFACCNLQLLHQRQGKQKLIIHLVSIQRGPRSCSLSSTRSASTTSRSDHGAADSAIGANYQKPKQHNKCNFLWTRFGIYLVKLFQHLPEV